MSEYDRCHYSITCQTDDLAVVHCLRGLSQHNVKTRHRQIAWGGTAEKDWQASGNCITLRFTAPEQREAFVCDATRLLLQGSWQEVARSDSDPARRQR